MFDWHFLDNGLDDEIGAFHRVRQARRPIDSADGVGNEFGLRGRVILDLLFGDSGQAILDAAERLINQSAVHLDQCDGIAGGGRNLQSVPTLYLLAEHRMSIVRILQRRKIRICMRPFFRRMAMGGIQSRRRPSE